MVKTYADLYLDARRAFLPADGMYASNLARELVCAASGKSPEAIVADRNLYASEEICARMEDYVRRHLAGEPIAYILGQWDFIDMTLTVTRDVLIPRDDTMAVVELAVKKALFLPRNPRILDLCTGSGCIGLAVARRVQDAKVTLSDLSQAALRVARKNAADLHLSGRVSCVSVDVTKPAAPFLGKYDLITANPPYVTTAELETLDPSVREYEPRMALDGGADGLDFYRAIAENFRTAIRPGGYLVLEFGQGQAEAVCAILREKDFEVLELRQDNSGITRAVLARYGKPEPPEAQEGKGRP